MEIPRVLFWEYDRKSSPYDSVWIEMLASLLTKRESRLLVFYNSECVNRCSLLRKHELRFSSIQCMNLDSRVLFELFRMCELSFSFRYWESVNWDSRVPQVWIEILASLLRERESRFSCPIWAIQHVWIEILASLLRKRESRFSYVN